MLSYNNKNDISEMMNYHRTRDMINLLKYFPDLSPIMDLTIVKDIDDYINNKEYCDSFMASRNDTLITKPSMASVETSGTTDGLLEIFKKVKEKNENVKVIIATNHLSFVRNFIGESFNVDYLDDLIISAEIHKIKPNSDFYEYILNKYNIDSKELLFLDDNIDNVNGAKQLGINTIKVEENTNLIEEISNFI